MWQSTAKSYREILKVNWKITWYPSTHNKPASDDRITPTDTTAVITTHRPTGSLVNTFYYFMLIAGNEEETTLEIQLLHKIIDFYVNAQYSEHCLDPGKLPCSKLAYVRHIFSRHVIWHLHSFTSPHWRCTISHSQFRTKDNVGT
jgi:hypothetical protein